MCLSTPLSMGLLFAVITADVDTGSVVLRGIQTGCSGV